MREINRRLIPRRTQGRPVLQRRLTALLVAVHRFARCRAASPADQAWAARLIAGLTALVQPAASTASESRETLGKRTGFSS